VTDRVGFIGLGVMGAPMARHVLAAGHPLTVHSRSAPPVDALVAEGAARASTPAELASLSDVVITMVPDTPDVELVLFGASGVAEGAAAGSLLIDMSTIDPIATRSFAERLASNDVAMLDAPVSGGIAGAHAATLTFMVGGSEADFARARPILEAMGKTIVHAGGAGNGQAAKICNNMILGVSMIAVCEAFVLAEKLGLDAQKLFDISSKSSGQCWSLTSYCPVPGPVPNSPANRDYQAGFTAAMMLKDLKLAQDAARAGGATTPLGAEAAAVYERYCGAGGAAQDFSGIIQFLRGR